MTGVPFGFANHGSEKYRFELGLDNTSGRTYFFREKKTKKLESTPPLNNVC